MRKTIVAGLLTGALVLCSVGADAAMTGYMTLSGSKTGPVRGGVNQKGREDTIMVVGASHSIVSPRDAASGMASGKRMHKPFVITKEVDKASPLLYKMLVTNDTIPTLEIKFYSPQTVGVVGKGEEAHAYTVKLTGASIASIDFHDVKAEGDRLAKTVEDIAFTYQKIEWTWVQGGVTASDTW